VDRVYIEHFLAAHAADIRGHALEVGDSQYTKRFGADRVSQSDVVDVRRQNPRATLIADLCGSSSLPPSEFDCVILTQTLHCLRDPVSALANLWQCLAPGGSLLMSVPAISRVDPVEDDYWRFTPLGLRTFLDDHWPGPAALIFPYGNLAAALSSLLGLAAHELRSASLRPHDEFFPLLVCARAHKPRVGSA
jgi:SAM-dependent methyltransferase